MSSKQSSKGNTHILHSFDADGKLSEIDEVKIYVPIQKRHFEKGEFFMTHFAFLDKVSEKNYSGLTLRVLVRLLRRIEFNNRISIFRQKELAEELKASQANISRVIKILEKDGIIVKRDDHHYYFYENYVKFAGNKAGSKVRVRRKDSQKLELEQVHELLNQSSEEFDGYEQTEVDFGGDGIGQGDS